ncbi:type II toxin-antitoxin system VapC family toxin [Candidatus Binatus sp.]|uniref:type II toxin-antitoxin system VapC family toxin n=1 Tax=Candidatus Binatus sp. TaxID=2811406 RepID=UPI003CA5DFCB
MSAYADTSFLVSLYTPDANSLEAASRMRRIALPVAVTSFGDLEFANALQLRLFRRELPAAKTRAAYSAFRDDVAAGVLTIKPMPDQVYAEARGLAQKWTRTFGTRTLDIIHVASALALGAASFHTFDERQRRLARAVKLTVR